MRVPSATGGGPKLIPPCEEQARIEELRAEEQARRDAQQKGGVLQGFQSGMCSSGLSGLGLGAGVSEDDLITYTESARKYLGDEQKRLHDKGTQKAATLEGLLGYAGTILANITGISSDVQVMINQVYSPTAKPTLDRLARECIRHLCELHQLLDEKMKVNLAPLIDDEDLKAAEWPQDVGRPLLSSNPLLEQVSIATKRTLDLFDQLGVVEKARDALAEAVTSN